MKINYGKNSFACGISWPNGQIIPHFSSPAETLDGIYIKELPKGEVSAFAALQGIVNSVLPRIIIIESGVDEGALTWIETSRLNVKIYSTEERYELLKKYLGEVNGAVLYSNEKSPHYRNAALTVAGTLRAIPVTPSAYQSFKAAGIELPVLADLTTLPYESAIDIYSWIYENIWISCNHRLLISMPIMDKYHLYDLATAISSAVVYLDCRIPEEKAVFELFLDDMKAGDGIVMGWYTTERSGISTVASHGLSTLPADYYANATVFAGLCHYIRKPSVPKKPKLENRIYIMNVISDGDNIQYNEHAMRVMWDRIEKNGEKGLIPLNWTISPSLPDVGPNLMNHYYDNASENDCFVSGPSGLGYALVYNTLEEPGAPCEDFMKNPETFKEYVRLTDKYLEKSGLRVVTIWDNATQTERDIYMREARYLRGLTVHVWCDRVTNTSSVNLDKRTQQLIPSYCGDINYFSNSLIKQCEGWDGNSPLFLAAQADVWGSITPTSLKELLDELNRRHNGKVDFVRADHYYALWGEANGIPFDLSLCDGVKAVSDGEDVSSLLNGTPSSGIYTAKQTGASMVDIELTDLFDITSLVIRHSEEANLCASLNVKDYSVFVSEDGENYKMIAEVRGNTESANYINTSCKAKYIRLSLDTPGKDGLARLACVEVYGKK